MKTCSVCQRCYEDDVAGCVENHGTLVAERAGTLEMIPNYRLDSLLERDAVGETYMAANAALDQPFVVRIIAQNLIIGAGEQARQMLQQEVQAAADFDHPNIVRIYESGWLDDGAFYIVSESVGDKTLQGLLRNTGSLSEFEAVKIARQSAEGLMAAHAAGIIHRAVSPANIILSRNSQNKLIVKLQDFDFGGIKQHTFADRFAVDTHIDTLRYLSPEQFKGKSVDAQTDVYSLGIVLYEMLCGRSPFNAPTSEAIADHQINEQPLSQLRFDVRALLTHTIKEALQRRPAARLQMGNFSRQLRHITQLILPLGENLPDTPQVLLSNKVTSDAPAFTQQSVIAEQPPHEIITLDNVDAALNVIAEQPNVAEIKENSSDEITYSDKSAPVFATEDKIEADLSAEKTIPAENSDANIDSLKSNPIFVEKKYTDEISFDSDVEQNEQMPVNEMPPLGELAPVFIMKDEPDLDSITAESISAESEDTNFESFESSPIFIEKKQVDEIPVASSSEPADEITADESLTLGELTPIFVGKNQVDEVPLESEQITIERNVADSTANEPEFFDLPDENIKYKRRAESAAPNFTNYPNETPPRRTLPLNRSALVGAGLLALLISVLLGALLYNRMQNPAASEQTTTAAASPTTRTTSDTVDDSTETAAVIDDNETTDTNLPDEPTAKRSDPVAVEKITSTAAKRSDQNLTKDTAAIDSPAKQDVLTRERVVRERSPSTNGNSQTELNSALDDWISATNSRDVEQQMNYYAPKLNAFYLTRNTSQSAVLAEKKRIFLRADQIDIQAGEPNITLSPDGRKATMRFRKKYAIKQGEKSRRGEVLQELQWVKSDAGWRIVSERDVKVINR